MPSLDPVVLYDQMLDALRRGLYGIAAVCGTVLAVLLLRIASARWWARAPWAWLRAAMRWCAGGPGGALLGGATALGVEVLAQAAGGPLTWWVLAGAIKTWFISMGVWAGAKNLLPPVARGASRQKARLGPAAVAALLAACLLGGAQAQARDWTPVMGGQPAALAPAYGSVLDNLSFGIEVGPSLRGGRVDSAGQHVGVGAKLALGVVGMVHLVEWRGWMMSFGLGGGILAALQAGQVPVELGGSLGVYFLLPVRPGGAMRAAFGLLWEYHLEPANPNPPGDEWRAAGSAFGLRVAFLL